MTQTSQELHTRRRHVRLEIHEGLTAEMRLTAVGQRLVYTRAAKVLILDISPGGVKFFTGLHLNPRVEWRVALRFQLEGLQLEIRGCIRHSSSEDHWYQYGVKMDDNPLMRLFIIRALNQRLMRGYPGLQRIHQLYCGMNAGDKQGKGWEGYM